MTDPRNLSPSHQYATRLHALSDLLDYAFDELFRISEHPNTNKDASPDAVGLAVRARDACAYIERKDPERNS